MKKLSILCSLVLLLGMAASQAYGVVSYGTDMQANGSFETEWQLTVGGSVVVDIYVNNMPTGDGLLTSGCSIYWDPSITVSNIKVYDGVNGPAGPWDSSMTTITETTPNSGYADIVCAQLGVVQPDVNGNIRFAQIQVDCASFGLDTLTIKPILGFDTVAGYPSEDIYDPELLTPIKDVKFCQIQECLVDGDCADADFCNGAETCELVDPGEWCGWTGSKVCVRGTNPCPNDGLYCNGTESCDEVADECIQVAVPCGDDGLYCNGTEGCNEVTDLCTHSGTPCPDDGLYCNGPDGCIEATDSCIPDIVRCPNDGLYCTGVESCNEDTNVCEASGNPCLDGEPCTTDSCIETTDTCTNVCNATSPTDPCCDEPECLTSPICLAGALVNTGDAFANCGDVGVKVPICLENTPIPGGSNGEVGGVQVDLCESIDDCLVCVGCEMTERTVIFDCVVNELGPEDAVSPMLYGCCRVIVFSKHPGGVINPGKCDIVLVDYMINDDPECCNTCIDVNPMNIVVSDQYGYDMGAAVGTVGQVCAVVCGDVYPPETAPGAGDCGDSKTDIFDILEEVSFALGSVAPDPCQAARADVPTGTPPNCIPKDGVVNILDVMVIIDMALNRQDCCSYVYGGKIY